MNQVEIEQFGEELYFIAASPASRRLRTQAELLSKTDVPLLITGEPGAGKATAARLIHSLSIRSSFPFVQVNCKALTADLLESELFGYEHLGINGRVETKIAKVEQAAKGTILLQNFDAIPISVQSRLLRLLQTREFVRFGGQSHIRADVRIMATSQGNLEQAVAEGKLNDELYYHLSAFELSVPALRERREEIPLFVGHFMSRLTRRYGVSAPAYSSTFLEMCKQYSWLGNLRQLEVFVKRFLAFGDEATALEELKSQPHDQNNDFHNGDSWQVQSDGHGGDEKASLKVLVRHAKGEAERSAIAQALEETHWNRKAAARALSISYRALLYKIQEYQLVPQESFSIRSTRNGFGNGS